MKKFIFTAVILAATCFSANAQKIKLGVKAGINFAELRNSIAHEARTGFHTGVIAEFKINEIFAIQPELIYSQQGAKSNVSIDELSYRVNYLNLPIIAKTYVFKGFSINAGPQMGYMLKGTMKFYGEEKDLIETNKFDLGLLGGLGYDFTKGYFLQLRYVAGLLKTNKSSNGDTLNRVASISAGYKF